MYRIDRYREALAWHVPRHFNSNVVFGCMPGVPEMVVCLHVQAGARALGLPIAGENL